MQNNFFKRTVQLIILLTIIISGIKLRHYVIGKDTAAGIVLTQPIPNTSVNGIIKISAKVQGDISGVQFILTNEKGEKNKEVKAFFEHDANEWTYYLNSNALKDDNYFIYAYASDAKSIYNDRMAITIDNGNENADHSIAAGSEQPIAFQIDSVETANNNRNPRIGTVASASSTSTTVESASTTPAQIKNTIPPGNPRPEASTNEARILSGVIKALSSIYDSINSNFNSPAPEKQMPLTPPIAKEQTESLNKESSSKNKGSIQVSSPANNISPAASLATTTNHSLTNNNSQNTEENDWFKYKLKITSVQENETISEEKLISAVCNNPMDSMDFILDNLETDNIDYNFKASSNYGYYTYWLYKLNPANIKPGRYLLYAEGTIDWHKYQSPIVMLNIK